MCALWRSPRALLHSAQPAPAAPGPSGRIATRPDPLDPRLPDRPRHRRDRRRRALGHHGLAPARRGPAPFDQPTGERFDRSATQRELARVIASLRNVQQSLRGVPLYARNDLLGRAMDGMFAERRLDAIVHAGRRPGRSRRVGLERPAPTRPAHALHPWRRIHGRQSEEPPNADGPLLRAHRRRRASVDYRLMPEHPRRAGNRRLPPRRLPLDASPTAWRPKFGADRLRCRRLGGRQPDASVTAWARDQGLRVPDAAVALSPLTDATLASPSLRAHRRSDRCSGPISASSLPAACAGAVDELAADAHQPARSRGVAGARRSRACRRCWCR